MGRGGGWHAWLGLLWPFTTPLHIFPLSCTRPPEWGLLSTSPPFPSRIPQLMTPVVLLRCNQRRWSRRFFLYNNIWNRKKVSQLFIHVHVTPSPPTRCRWLSTIPPPFSSRIPHYITPAILLRHNQRRGSRRFFSCNNIWNRKRVSQLFIHVCMTPSPPTRWRWWSTIPPHLSPPGFHIL